MNNSQPNSEGAGPLVDLEQLQSASDGDIGLLQELMKLYFRQADEIMAGLGKAITESDVAEVDHLSHKLAGSSLTCGMSALVPPLRLMERNAKAGNLIGAPEAFAEVEIQLEAVRQYMDSYVREHAV